MDYKVSSGLIKARESDCVFKCPTEDNRMCRDMSAVSSGNRGKPVGSCRGCLSVIQLQLKLNTVLTLLQTV